ncbi:LysR family transcriptional regulator [Inquilinus sp. KBS0705]|nr:LysR family transcriptional regulator [Inquilinus sp. KBS0705]
MDNSFALNGRIWLETANGKLLGKGRVELLERIQQSGSLRQAAVQMKMSYRQAWDMVNQMNLQFSSPVLILNRGGKGGGSAQVTEKGLQVVAQFHAINKKFREFLAENQSAISL